jgi:hypothetical protein
MSAASTADRDDGRALAGHFQQEVEWAGHLTDRTDGDAGVERCGVELLVSEKNPRLRGGRLLPCSTRMTIRSLSISVSFSEMTCDDRWPVA